MALIPEVIEYEGDNSSFVWKYPREIFVTGSQLIVHESQDAVFFANGQALDSFKAGRYTLETENLPLIGKLLNIQTGGKTPFHCEVYFINLVEQMAIRWGTDTKVQYIEPTFKFPLSLGASGEMSLSVSEPRKLLCSLVGTENSLERPQLVSFFRALLMTKVKTYIAQEMRGNEINIFEIDESLEKFSEDLKARLIPDFLEYGMNLRQFFVTTIVKPDGNPQYERFKELYFRQYADVAEAELRQKIGLIEKQTEAQKIIIESEAIAKKREKEGYTYQQERGFDVAQGAAENEASGQLANLGVGIAMMSGVSQGIGGKVNSAINEAIAEPMNNMGVNDNKYEGQFCPKCGAKIIPNAKFCDECGAPQRFDEFCKKCGFKFTRHGNFCPECGAKRETRS
ncbi:MAG: SPFH domain-containing protein [Eubacteriales bacterium]